MSDPVGGLREMARVTRPGGIVAASTWDLAGERAPISPYWQGVRAIEPENQGEAHLPGAAEGQLAALFAEAGLREVQAGELTIRVPLDGFDDWWAPFAYGVGPVGQHFAQLDDDARTELRAACRRLLPDGPFELSATAWLAVGRT
jgi:hypothetical protein